MKPLVQRVTAMLRGKMLTTVGIGRFDYMGRFQPFGTVDFEVDYKQGPSGLWVATANGVQVPFVHHSPRIITHAGLFIFDRWYLDELPKEHQRGMAYGDVAVFSTEHIIEEPRNGETGTPEILPDR